MIKLNIGDQVSVLALARKNYNATNNGTWERFEITPKIAFYCGYTYRWDGTYKWDVRYFERPYFYKEKRNLMIRIKFSEHLNEKVVFPADLIHPIRNWKVGSKLIKRKRFIYWF